MLEALLSPEGVAIIGASRKPRKVGHEVVADLIDGGFEGAVVPVNPDAPEVLGLKCYPDIREYGRTIDLSVVAVLPKHVLSFVRGSVAAKEYDHWGVIFGWGPGSRQLRRKLPLPEAA